MNADRKRARETAVRWQSRYIRLRDAIRTTGTDEYAACVTCGAIHPIEQMDAGHFIPGRRDATMWDEFNVHAQCKKCNKYLSGNLILYREFMMRAYGKPKVDELWERALRPVKMTATEYREMATYYRLKYNQLKEDFAQKGRRAI